MQRRSVLLYVFFLQLIPAVVQICPGQVEQRLFRVMFYNVENLFDPFNDSLINDEDFLPGETRSWTYGHFYEKVNKIAKVIIASGDWDPPAVVGLCEIENRFVLERLTRHSPLLKAGYRIIHYNSPDPRGVDVALLYRPVVFTPVTHRPLTVIFPTDTTARTRDILYIKGLINQKDTIHLLVNHWPSKYGGEQKSAARRIYVAGLIKTFTDSIMKQQETVNILLMGDFNEGPGEGVLANQLGARNDTACKPGNHCLFNVSAISLGGKGTHKFQGEWTLLDQFICSNGLLHGNAGLKLPLSGVRIISPDFLLEEDAVHMGHRPNRTFQGPRYHGGFSDHLPVSVDIILTE